MSPSHGSEIAGLGLGKRSDQNSADDTDLSRSDSPSQPGSSRIPRYDGGPHHKQPFQVSGRTDAFDSTPSHLPSTDSQSGYSQANSRSGFFAGASNINASHGVFNDIAGDYNIINVGFKVC